MEGARWTQWREYINFEDDKNSYDSDVNKDTKRFEIVGGKDTNSVNDKDRAIVTAYKPEPKWIKLWRSNNTRIGYYFGRKLGASKYGWWYKKFKQGIQECFALWSN